MPNPTPLGLAYDPLANSTRRLQKIPAAKTEQLRDSFYGSYEKNKRATAWPLVPPAEPGRAEQLISRIFPYKPPILQAKPEHGSPAPAYELAGKVYVQPGYKMDTEATAHEYEHAVNQYMKDPVYWKNYKRDQDEAVRTGNTTTPTRARSTAEELPATFLGHLLPQASWQSGGGEKTLANQRHDLIANFSGGYQPSMTYLHNQAQRHGVFGPTNLSRTLGNTNPDPVSMTSLFDKNPQFIGLLAGQEMPSKSSVKRLNHKETIKPMQLGRPRRPDTPNLLGLIP